MGAYLAYYGQGQDALSFSSDADRQQACLGYVATALNVKEVFYIVLSRWVVKFCVWIPTLLSGIRK
jgi:hypothetical protein